MTKINPLTNILFLLVAIVFCAIPQCLAALSDKQLCYDPDCSEVISLAKTILAYRANDREIMSFGINEDVKIFSKGAGKRTDLWGVEINGKRGFAPKSFLHEHKILQSNLVYEVPVYKFMDEVKDKVQIKTGNVHKVHPLLKDKLSDDDNETLSFSAKSLNKNIQEKNVESKKLESTEEIHKVHSSIKDNLSHDDNETPLLSTQSLDETVPEIEATDVDNISPSYEVIDGTTFYFENKPSVQQKFATEAMHATALPNEQASLTNSKTDSDNNDDKTIFIDIKEIPHDANNFNNKLEEIKLSVDISEETNTKTPLEDSDTIIDLTVDIVEKDDAALHDGSSKSADKTSKDLENEDKSVNNNVDENVEYKKDKPTENVEEEGAFVSFARRFNILPDLVYPYIVEATTMESTTSSNDNDLSTFEAIVEENTSATEKLSSVDPSIMSKDNTETQQEIIHENIQTTTFSNKEIKPEEETIAVHLENAASRDVPLSNNFVHKDAYEPVQDSSIASSVLTNNSSASKEIYNSNNAENIKIQEANKEENIIENIKTEGAIASPVEGLAVSSDVQETTTTKSISTQSNDDTERTSPESDKAYLENTKEDVHKETIVQMGDVAAVDVIPETDHLSSVKDMLENITKETLSDSPVVEEGTVIINDDLLNRNAADIQLNAKSVVHSNVNKNDNLMYDASSGNVPIESNEFSNGIKSSIVGPEQSADSSQKSMISEEKWAFDGYLRNRDSESIKEDFKHKNVENQIHNSIKGDDKTLPEYSDHINSEDKILPKDEDIKGDNEQTQKRKSIFTSHEIEDNVCSLDECTTENIIKDNSELLKKVGGEEGDYMIDTMTTDHNYLKMLICLVVTAVATLVFTLGYYYIENIRRDNQLIANINKLQKELLISEKDLLNTKKYINDIIAFMKELCSLMKRDAELFDSNEIVEMVQMAETIELCEIFKSLNTNLRASQKSKTELEEQVTVLEKELESATEAGLELERMFKDLLLSSAVNPLAESVEDLQVRLDAQQAANESLTNALNLKSQEIETLSTDLAVAKKKYEELEVEVWRVQKELDSQRNLKNNIEETFIGKVHSLEVQVNELSSEKLSLDKELRGKEIEVKELIEVINQIKSNNLDVEKLCDVLRVKTEAEQLREERDELKMRLSDVEGAHQLLEEHMKLVKEEVATLSEQGKIAEKEKKDAETQLEVLSKFFKEKEAERQKEEAIWLQQQGEVVSTVERIHTMQNEIQNYKQQIEMSKREIVDQEREYKNQIAALETKSHEQWVAARQNERRMEEMRVEAGQLRNRLTLAEKTLNDSDSETKLHRLEANGETATSPPLFIGAESSSSPVMFSSGVPPPPPPSYLCYPPHLPPVLPLGSGFVRTQYDSLSQRPPPLGGRLSSPPPMPPPPLHPPAHGGRYENASSPPPQMSPHLLPPLNRRRSPPPPPFGGDYIPPFPPPGTIILPPPPIGTAPTWAEESLPPPRSSGSHPHQREKRARNHKGSLHSSGESLDKAHQGKV